MTVGIYVPNWVGDAVMSFPFLNACHRLSPEDEIVVVARSWVSAVFENHPLVHSMIVSRGEDSRGIVSTTEWGMRLRNSHFDMFYLLSDSLRCAYLAWLSRSARRIGFRGQWRSWLLTDPIGRPIANLHRSQKYLLLLDRHHASTSKADGKYGIPAVGISFTEAESRWAREQVKKLRLNHPLAVFPSSIADSRQVPIEKWEQVLELALGSGREILLFGGSRDRRVGNQLLKKMGNKSVKSVCGSYSLRQSIVMISQCEGAIGTDSGLSHVAANLGLKTVVLFGAGDPSQTGPKGPRARIISEQVYCSPCRRNVCRNSREPLICLESIDASTVWQAYCSLS